MKILACGVSLVMAVASTLVVTAGAADEAGDPAAGKAKAAVCAACHGADGNSVNPAWPKLAGQNAKYIERQVEAIKTKQRHNSQTALMRPLVVGLSAQDVRNIAAYFATQTGTIGKASKDSVALGQRIYRGGDADTGVPACMSCHGPAGFGNPLAGYPRLAGQHAPYVVAQLEAFRSGARTTDPNQMMRMVAKRLSDEQIHAVSSYVSGLH